MRILLVILVGILSSSIGNAQWTQLNDAPFVAHHTNGFGINGKGYLIKGLPDQNGGVSQNEFWEYDPVSDAWTQMGFVPGPARSFSIGDDMNGKYYFGFGNERNDLWEYDPVTNEFKELASCPCEVRAHPAFVAHNEKIYMGSGSGNNGDLRDWWVYDFATDSWSQKANIPGPNRHHPFQFGIDNAIYVGGGHISNWLRYDIPTETWMEINDFPQGRVAGTQFSYKGKGFTLSGDNAQHATIPDNQFLVYYPELDEWHELPFEDEMHRWAPSSFIIEDKLYYFGGFSSVGNNDSNMWSFDLNFTDCLQPTEVNSASITANSANILWSISPTGTIDRLQYRIKGTTDWTEIADPQTPQLLNDLESCTEYEYRINSNCGPDASAFSEIGTFLTIGCGTCTDADYCDVQSIFAAQNCYIESVSFGDYENVSGNNSGYRTFISPTDIEVNIGETLELEVTPGFIGFNVIANVKVWIDLNADGEFSDEELVSTGTGFTGTHSDEILIDDSAQPGLSRIRVVANNTFIGGACGGGNLLTGEAEDYCIQINDQNTSSKDVLANSPFSVFPNPVQDQIVIEGIKDLDIQEIRILDINGKLMYRDVQGFQGINVSSFSNGTYLIQVISNENTYTEKVVKQ